MATEKRERQRANRQLKQQAQVKEERREQTKRRALTWGLGILGLFAVVLGLIALGGGFSGDDDEGTAPEVAGFQYGTGACPPEAGSDERVETFDDAPQLCIDPSATYTAQITTNVGDLTVELDAAAAPGTVNNFVVLARYHYFDGTPCHRAITGFMVQCGDPTGTGMGDPGYEIANENPAANTDYGLGAVAMANSGPDTNGSQFFITTSDSSPSLETNYSLFGQVTDGLDTTLTALDALGSNPDADNGVPPSEPITIESITITEGDAATEGTTAATDGTTATTEAAATTTEG